MVTTVEMPKLGNTVEDCLIAAWRKHKGDTVAAGDVIAEIETDKTNFDLTAPVDGVLLETFFEAGALVPVFTAICAIGAAGEEVERRAPPAGGADGQAPVPADMPSVAAGGAVPGLDRRRWRAAGDGESAPPPARRSSARTPGASPASTI